MTDYILSCCSTVDLNAEHLKSCGIEYLGYHYFLNGEEHVDDLGQSLPYNEFYAAMAAGASTRTSQINAEEYLTYFEPFLKAGKDILHICLSSGLSGTYHNAVAAAKIAMERYPNRKLKVVDSLGASSGEGLFVDELASLKNGGMGMDELYAWAMDNRLRAHHWFFSTDLSYYVRGGRISKASAIFGGMLDICPLLDMDDEGHLIARHKIRTKRRVKREIVKMMEKYADGGLEYSGKCFISHADCLADAQDVAHQVEQLFPKLNGKVVINSIGTTIGSHTGPGTVALFFWGKKR